MTALVTPAGDQLVDDSSEPAAPAAGKPGRGAGRRRTQRQRKAQAPRKPQTASRRALVLVPAVLGGLAAWFLLYAFALTPLQAHANQARLYERYRLELALATAPLGGSIKAGSPVAMITAPSAHIHNVVVVEGSTSRLLAGGPGHVANTVLPGQSGTSTILGRSVTFGAPFGHVAAMKPGDKLTVATAQGQFTFSVEDVRHAGTRLPQPLAAGQSRLTLVTSASNGWRAGWAPTSTVYVDALLIHGQAQPSPPGRPSTVSNSSRPMQGDPDALVPLIFWLEGLVVIALALRWSWIRWGRAQTWIVGAPLLLAVLWWTSGALMRFLPNLI